MATGGSVGGATISVVVVGTPVGVRVVVRPVARTVLEVTGVEDWDVWETEANDLRVRVVVGVRVGRAGTVVSGTVVVTL